MREELLSVRGLKTFFYTRKGTVKAVDGLSYDIKRGEIFGLVGESGCGKSVSALSVMRLVPDPPGKIVGGDVLFEGESLLAKSNDEMTNIRGSKISMIFQDPTSSLNPIMRIGEQIMETIQKNQRLKKAKAKEKAIEILKSVGIPSPLLRFQEYPFQYSGGMRQRIMISIAIACNPSLLIADEPTTNLDVTIQAQILDLIKNISKSNNMSVLLITHNLGIIAWLCDKVAVMYAGEIVECADTETIFLDPRHPYTRALLECVPKFDQKQKQLMSIKGRVPNLISLPSGCKFHPRCSYAIKICSKEKPQTVEIYPGHSVSCHLLDKITKEKLQNEYVTGSQ